MAVVVITGCSSGIGFEGALSFARAGDTVCATMRDMRKADKLQKAASEEGLILDIRELDVTKAHSFEEFVKDIIKTYNQIDVLVNNAGILPVGAFEDIEEDELRRTMETNFFGPALLTRAVLPHMRENRQGYIIMVGSLSGFAAKAGDSVYSASKFALEGLTEGFHQEIARWNIKTALVQPGQYITNIFSSETDGPLGACDESSPYYSLIQQQQIEMMQNLHLGNSPRDLGDLLVKISRSDGKQFRWQADVVAEHVFKRIFSLTDQEREKFLQDVAGIEWWMSGLDAPNKKGSS